MTEYEKAAERRARVVRTPYKTADHGFCYGSDCLLVIGNAAVNFGQEDELAKEVAAAWNAAIAAGAIRRDGK